MTNASDYERVPTHRLSQVAKLMGYTSQGIKDLCKACLIASDWRVIGMTRASKERVAARFNYDAQRYEFAVGSDSFALTADAAEQQRIRDEVAEAVVNRVKAQRPQVNKALLKQDQDQRPVDDQGSTDGLSRPESMIISPVAPRDPRGLEAAERALSGRRKGMSRP